MIIFATLITASPPIIVSPSGSIPDLKIIEGDMMNIQGISLEAAKHRVVALVPVLRWLPSYDKTWL
ncbi:MAG: hypothetical protein MUE45_06265, partial [Methanoregulaceae archaeon]|nr:hypothetical protein [Methanoregulaceae archaeon]